MNSLGKLPWKKKSLQGYKKPVLTLLGDKDGYLNYLYSLQEYQDLENSDGKNKPIIIENGINHLQMCDNIETNIAKFLQKKDCPSELSLEQAHHTLSFTIAGLLTIRLLLKHKNNLSLARINQYKQLEDSVNNISVKSQYYIIGPKKSKLLPIKNTIHTNFKDFLFSKPSIEDDGLILIHSYQSKTLTNNLYSPSLWLKTKIKNQLYSIPCISI